MVRTALCRGRRPMTDTLHTARVTRPGGRHTPPTCLLFGSTCSEPLRTRWLGSFRSWRPGTVWRATKKGQHTHAIEEACCRALRDCAARPRGMRGEQLDRDVGPDVQLGTPGRRQGGL